MSGKNVIFAGPAYCTPVQTEAKVKTGETILPGAVVVKSSGELANHGTAGAGGAVYVANINTLEQKTVADALTVGDTAQAFVVEAGQSYNVLVAASEVVTVDLALASAGDGTVTAATTTGATPDVVLFYAEEALTVGASAQLVRCRVAQFGSKATA